MSMPLYSLIYRKSHEFRFQRNKSMFAFDICTHTAVAFQICRKIRPNQLVWPEIDKSEYRIEVEFICLLTDLTTISKHNFPLKAGQFGHIQKRNQNYDWRTSLSSRCGLLWLYHTDSEMYVSVMCNNQYWTTVSGRFWEEFLKFRYKVGLSGVLKLV